MTASLSTLAAAECCRLKMAGHFITDARWLLFERAPDAVADTLLVLCGRWPPTDAAVCLLVLDGPGFRGRTAQQAAAAARTRFPAAMAALAAEPSALVLCRGGTVAFGAMRLRPTALLFHGGTIYISENRALATLAACHPVPSIHVLR